MPEIILHRAFYPLFILCFLIAIYCAAVQDIQNPPAAVKRSIFLKIQCVFFNSDGAVLCLHQDFQRTMYLCVRYIAVLQFIFIHVQIVDIVLRYMLCNPVKLRLVSLIIPLGNEESNAGRKHSADNKGRKKEKE